MTIMKSLLRMGNSKLNGLGGYVGTRAYATAIQCATAPATATVEPLANGDLPAAPAVVKS